MGKHQDCSRYGITGHCSFRTSGFLAKNQFYHGGKVRQGGTST
jgi:hypothetical protein